MDTNNIVDFPATEGDTALQIARALVDYVKNRPNAHVISIVSDPEESTITMGWSKIDAAHMLLMLHFANMKWEQSTFAPYLSTDDDPSDAG